MEANRGGKSNKISAARSPSPKNVVDEGVAAEPTATLVDVDTLLDQAADSEEDDDVPMTQLEREVEALEAEIAAIGGEIEGASEDALLQD